MWWEFSAHNCCGNPLNYCSLIDKSRLEQGDTSSLSVHASTFSLAFESFANPCQWQPEWLNSWCYPCHDPGNSARLIPSPLALYKDAVPPNITLQLQDWAQPVIAVASASFIPKMRYITFAALYALSIQAQKHDQSAMVLPTPFNCDNNGTLYCCDYVSDADMPCASTV